MSAIARPLLLVASVILSLSVGPQCLAQSNPTTALDAVQRSMAQPDAPLEPMWIRMKVCGTGSHRGSGYLNSLRDYRDRQSLNIELPARVRYALAQQLEADPVDALNGREILVYGQVRQVRIRLLHEGRPTGQFYYQTHLQLSDPAHLEVLPAETGIVSDPCDTILS